LRGRIPANNGTGVAAGAAVVGVSSGAKLVLRPKQERLLQLLRAKAA